MTFCKYCGDEIRSTGGCMKINCQQISMGITNQTQYNQNPHRTCNCHQCTWLRASQIDRELVKLKILGNDGE